MVQMQYHPTFATFRLCLYLNIDHFTDCYYDLRFLQVIHLQLDNVAGEVSPPGVSVHQQMLQHHPLIIPHAGRLSSAPLSQRVWSVERTCSGGTEG